MEPEVHFAGRESVGGREGQEDTYGCLPMTNAGQTDLLFVVCDGMGGEVAGQVASEVAVKGFANGFFAQDRSGGLPEKLRAALDAANINLRNTLAVQPHLEGMGCTLVAGYCTAGRMDWISVGDSPLYVYRNGWLQRINADHSMEPLIQEQLRLGQINAEGAKNHPERHVLRVALVGDSLEMVDTCRKGWSLRTGDWILAATDGLLSLSEAEIQKVVARYCAATAAEMAQGLIDTVIAKNDPYQDNVTVFVVNGDKFVQE